MFRLNSESQKSESIIEGRGIKIELEEQDKENQNEEDQLDSSFLKVVEIDDEPQPDREEEGLNHIFNSIDNDDDCKIFIRQPKGLDSNTKQKQEMSMVDYEIGNQS